MDKDSGKMLNYRQLIRHPLYKDDWTKSSANKFGRLAQGVGRRIKGTNTIEFIHHHEIPKDRNKDVTYGKFVCTMRPERSRGRSPTKRVESKPVLVGLIAINTQ